MSKSTFVYVTFIRTTPERLWAALTTPEFIKQYWMGVHCECDWKRGSPWKISFEDGRIADRGEIAEIDPPKRLVIKWQNEFMEEMKAEGASLCTFEIETVPDVSPAAVKLSVTHVMERPESKFIQAVSRGWPQILSNLKSLLETGEIALKASKKTA
jgi:uncharacterized protein YndB with AHSA1/START domain